ncbi:hypothetical protein Tco_0431630 [Tanacetum coccineum]
MRTRSQARKRRQQQVQQTSVESSNLEKPDNPPIVTMADNRTMAQLLEAPTEESPRITLRSSMITSTMNVPNTSVKLMLFPFSLEGAARIWLEKEPPRSIETWDDLVPNLMSMLVKDTRSQDGKDDKDNDKGSKSRSQSMKEQAYNEDKDQEHSSLNDKSNLTDLMKECHQ